MSVHTRARVVLDTAPSAVWDGSQENAPMVVYREWVQVATCDCKVVVGIRIDTQEQATVCCPCEQPAHLQLISRVNDLLRASLAHPTDRLLGEVICEMVDKVYV